MISSELFLEECSTAAEEQEEEEEEEEDDDDVSSVAATVSMITAERQSENITGLRQLKIYATTSNRHGVEDDSSMNRGRYRVRECGGGTYPTT